MEHLNKEQSEAVKIVTKKQKVPLHRTPPIGRKPSFKKLGGDR